MGAKLTNAEYIKAGGMPCPFCGSDNNIVDSSLGAFEQEPNGQRRYCYTCGAKWWDSYELKGYNEIQQE